LALGGGKWSAAHPGHFIPIKSSADWVGTTVWMLWRREEDLVPHPQN